MSDDESDGELDEIFGNDDELDDNDIEETVDDNDDNEDNASNTSEKSNVESLVEDDIDIDSDIGDNDAVEDGDDLLDDDIKVSKNTKFVYVYVPDDERRTSNYIGKFDLTNILSTRAELISKNNDPYVDCSDLDDPYKMALREFEQRKCPLYLEKQVGEHYDPSTDTLTIYIERWDINQINRN